MQSLQLSGRYDTFLTVIYMRQKISGSLLLLLATVIWGSAFVSQSVGMDSVGPFTFQSVRCLLAVAALLAAVFLRDRNFLKFKSKQLWKAGFLCGSALFLASSLQQVGLIYTTAGKGGFITAMYIVLVPLIGFFLKKKTSKSTFFSIIPAVIGLYLLSGTDLSAINTGDLLMMGCAVAFAVQIICIDRFAGMLDSLSLNCVQSLVCAGYSLLCMFFGEDPKAEALLSCWLPLCHAGILSLGVAYTLQIVGQRVLEPTVASLIMSLESVFAVLFGWLILKETMSGTEIAGCILVFSAVILSQIPTKSKKSASSV